MIAGCDRRDAWVGLSPDLKTITSEPTVGKGNTINESEMALFSECMQSCAQKVLDTGRHCQRRDVSPVDNQDRQWTPHTLGCNIPKATLLLASPQYARNPG